MINPRATLGAVVAAVLLTSAGAATAQAASAPTPSVTSTPSATSTAPAPTATPTPTDEVVRIGGEDRFETSALISAATFPEDVPVAYIASGANYPDALSAAAAAGAQDAPVLLVHKDEVPQVIVDELSRLNPTRVVIVGGTDVISDRVQTIVGKYSLTSRIGGATRFETSALLSATFEPGVDVAYIASGSNYPDALAGAAAAGSMGGPVLLVHGTEIPAAVLTELARLEPKEIVVLGGTAAISSEVEANLERYVAPTIRLGGATRFDTATLVSSDAYPDGASTVYVTSGANFPDALAGAAAAGSEDAPVLLVHPTEIPPSVVTELERLKPTNIVVLGGTTVVSKAVATALEAYVD
jgi:putative cell wall-binding protein